MYNQGDREYLLKGSYLEVKHYYGLMVKKLAIKQTEALGDIDLDILEKYEKDIQKFELNLLQIEEACEAIENQIAGTEDDNKKKELLAKIPEIKERRNYDSIKANYEACKKDFEDDRRAQRQLKLRTDLFAGVWVDIVLDENFTMDILKNILIGDTANLTFDVMFAMEVLRDFFTNLEAMNPLLRNLKDNTIAS